MKMMTKIIAVGCLGLALSTQAALINISTGVNNNWMVQQTAPVVGAPMTAVEAVPPGGPGTFPIVPPYWLANDADSQWVTISTPIDLDPLGPEGNDRTYVYYINFTAVANETGTLRWLSDNVSEISVFGPGGLVLNETHAPVGAYPTSAFNTWSDTFNIDFTPGNWLVALEVVNLGQEGGGPNPTGARVELFAPVPEPATIAAGALLLLPFAASTIRRFRKS